MVSFGPHRAGPSTLALCRSASVPNLPPEQLERSPNWLKSKNPNAPAPKRKRIGVDK
jgi:hypothetical protein